MKKKWILLIFLMSTLLIFCKKDRDNQVPNTLVDVYVYTSNPSFINLAAVGGWAYIAGGVRGILVYRKSSNEFMAYDRNCTYQSNQPCATVYVNNTNIMAEDTCCLSKFGLFDGNATQGPASQPLKSYNTTYDGNILHIFN